MYTSKQILPAHGQLKVNVIFTFFDRASKSEVGYSQSVNVQNNLKQMYQEAVLNAFYKLNHRIGGVIFSNSSADELELNVKKVTLLKTTFSYYEDRIYRYKRVKQRGKYVYEIRRKGRVYQYVKPNYLSRKRRQEIADDIL